MSTGEPAVMANKRFTLSPEQLRAFSDQGLLKVDFGFDPQLLDQIITEVRPLYGTAYEDDPSAAIRCQDGWKEVDAVRQLAVHDSVLAALRMLMDREPLPFQTLNFPVGTSQYPHSDSIHFHTIPAGFMVGVWVALENIDAENGPLIYYPGSHKLPYYSMQDLGLGPGYSNYHAYELRIQDLIAEHGLQSELGLLEKRGSDYLACESAAWWCCTERYHAQQAFAGNALFFRKLPILHPDGKPPRQTLLSQTVSHSQSA